MKSKQFRKRLIVSLLLVYCYQQTTATRAIKGAKVKNVTTPNTQANQTLELNGQEVDTNKTTTIATTKKPELLDATPLPAAFGVDGRHAFVNNQFVAEDEESPLTSTLATSYNPLQHSPSYTYDRDYNRERPDMQGPLKRDPSVAGKLPASGYNMGQFDDYDEEETSDYASGNDAMPENCEDTQESLITYNYNDVQNPIVHDDATSATYQNKLFDSLGYKTQTNENLLGSYDNEDLLQNSHINPALLYVLKPATKLLAQHLYDQTDLNKNDLLPSGHVQQYNTFVHSKPIYTLPPNYNRAETQQSFFNYQNPRTTQKTKENYNKPSYNLYDQSNFSSNTTATQNPANFQYGNSNMQTTSPFSSTSSHQKKFKTVSSSIQYVSTPLADLVFRYSIGMAKHSNSKPSKNSSEHQGNVSQVRNNINGKTE